MEISRRNAYRGNFLEVCFRTVTPGTSQKLRPPCGAYGLNLGGITSTIRNPEKGGVREGGVAQICRKLRPKFAQNCRYISYIISFRTSEEGCAKLSQIRQSISDNFMQIPLFQCPFLRISETSEHVFAPRRREDVKARHTSVSSANRPKRRGFTGCWRRFHQTSPQSMHAPNLAASTLTRDRKKASLRKGSFHWRNL